MLLELTNIGLRRERDAAIDASKPMSPVKYLVLSNSPALTDVADIRTLTLADINEVDRLDINESGAVERVADGTAKFHGHVQVGNAYRIRGVCVVLEDGDLYAYTAYRPESGGFDKPADLAFSFYVVQSYEQSAVMAFTYEPLDSDKLALTVVNKALSQMPESTIDDLSRQRTAAAILKNTKSLGDLQKTTDTQAKDIIKSRRLIDIARSQLTGDISAVKSLFSRSMSLIAANSSAIDKKIGLDALYKDKYIVLASGQSNILGRGLGGVFKINAKVKIWHNTANQFQVADFESQTYPTTCQDHPFQVGDGRNNMALAFCQRLQEESGADVYLIINGAPGQSIKKWTDGTYLDDLSDVAQAAIAEIGGEVDAFLWCQGEADQPTLTKAQYIVEFRKIVSTLKSNDWFKSPAFAACQVPQSWRELNGYTGGVDAFLTGLDGTDQLAGWATTISTDGADMHDNVHYSGSALYDIGYNTIYEELYQSLVLRENTLKEAEANSISQTDRQRIAAGILRNTQAVSRLANSLRKAGI